MQTVPELLQEYFKGLSNGVIDLSEAQALEVCDLVLNSPAAFYTAELHKFNNQLNTYTPALTIRTTLEKIRLVLFSLTELNGIKQTEGFYRYDLKDPTGEPLHCIYSVNPALFD